MFEGGFMNLNWIDDCINGIIEYCCTDDIIEICNLLDINICKLDDHSSLLKGGEAVYIRSYLDQEIIFIKKGLPQQYERFLIAHELGHAILHPEISTAAFNNKLLNKGKLERQSNYFAIKLLKFNLSPSDYEGYTIEQIAKELYISESCVEYCFIEN